MPTLTETLALLYLSTVLLHLPVSMGDIHQYVDHGLRSPGMNSSGS